MSNSKQTRLAVFQKVNLRKWKQHWQPIVETLPLIADIGLGEDAWDYATFVYAVRRTEGRQNLIAIGASAHEPVEAPLASKLITFTGKEPGLGQLTDAITNHLADWRNELLTEEGGPGEFDYLVIEVHSELGFTMHGRPHQVVSPVWIEELDLMGRPGFEGQIEKVTASGQGMVLELSHAWLMNSLADTPQGFEGSAPRPVDGIDNKFGSTIRRRLIEQLRQEGRLSQILSLHVEIDWRPRIRSANGRTLVHTAVETYQGCTPFDLPPALHREVTKKASQWLRETGLLLDTPPSAVYILSYKPGNTDEFVTYRIGHSDDTELPLATSNQELANRMKEGPTAKGLDENHSTAEADPPRPRIQPQQPLSRRPVGELKAILGETYESLDPNSARANLWRNTGMDPDLVAMFKLENRKVLIRTILGVSDTVRTLLPDHTHPDAVERVFDDVAYIFADPRASCDFESLLLSNPKDAPSLRTNPGEKFQTKTYHEAISNRVMDPLAIRGVVSRGKFSSVIQGVGNSPSTPIHTAATVLFDEGLELGALISDHPTPTSHLRMVTWTNVDGRLICDAFIQKDSTEEEELDGHIWTIVDLYRQPMHLALHSEVDLADTDEEDRQTLDLLKYLSSMITDPGSAMIIAPVPDLH